ncbi:MAG: VOC family protein [Ignavibacteria bacterium]|nr:VOC family protein [Ignavibacteria bacterium]
MKNYPSVAQTFLSVPTLRRFAAQGHRQKCLCYERKYQPNFTTTYKLTTSLFSGLLILSLTCCNYKTNDKVKDENKQNSEQMNTSFNPVVYFEIPVTDIDRATKFYKSVFQFDFEKEVIDHNEMALFPFTDGQTGISGALAKGEIYKPTKNGVVIYFKTLNIDNTLKLAIENGGHILYPKTDNGLGFVAEFEDTEGNRIALHQSPNK